MTHFAIDRDGMPFMLTKEGRGHIRRVSAPGGEFDYNQRWALTDWLRSALNYIDTLEEVMEHREAAPTTEEI